MGIRESSTFSTLVARVTITSCPTQQKGIRLMMRVAESRMGYTSQRQQIFGIDDIVKLLTLIKEEAEEQEQNVAREYLKVGAAVATAVCASLRGSEVFMMELTALQKHIHLGRDGTMPLEPMRVGVVIYVLSMATHVIITLLGEFKGELGFKYHLMSLASKTNSGIE